MQMSNIKKSLKASNGITLIALVITIIVLLILAGISISMLSGDNGILTRAGDAKDKTDIAGEKEILQTSALAAISKEKYGDLTKEKLDNELNNYSEIENTEQVDAGIAVTFKSGRVYLVDLDGNVSRYNEIAVGELTVKNGTTEVADGSKSVPLNTALTINFTASISEGSITSISPTLPYTTNGTETSKTFTITGTGGVTKQYIVNLKGYYNIPELKVGDFVNYALKTPTTEELAQLNNDISTYSGATDNTEKTSAGSTLLCRVLEIDETTGNPTKLISADGVNSLSLYGANGYNNAVYLINEMCKTLYSGNQGTTTSLIIEDLENNYFDSTALTTAKGSKYGKKLRCTGYYSRYPLLATKEKRMGIDTTTETVEGNTFNILNTSNTALDLSEQGRSDLELGGGTTTNATNGITVTITSYQMNEGNSNYKNAALNNIMHKTSSNAGVSTYWLASRCVFSGGSFKCGFDISVVDAYKVSPYYLFDSEGSTVEHSFAIRPVITLNSEIEADYSGTYNSTYNTWTLQ